MPKITKNNRELSSEEINWFDYYLPFDSFRHKQKDHNFTTKIRSMKFDHDLESINHFISLIEKHITGSFILIPVPSSTAGNINSGINKIVNMLSQRNKNFINGTKCLVRHTSIVPAHEGGRRIKNLHRQTIAVENADFFRNKNVLLIDDIYTTGKSMNVCKEKLMNAKAQKVFCVALAVTTRANIKNLSFHSETVRTAEIIHFLTFIEGIGSATINKILEFINNNDIDLSFTNLIYVFNKISENGKKFKIPTYDEIVAIYYDYYLNEKEIDAEGIRRLTPEFEDYPTELSSIKNPPPLLFVKGFMECLNENPTIAILGTRNPKQQSYEMAESIATFFAEKGVTIVSGLARGCDTAAHKACLKANGKTAAVLAHGLDMVYPPENKTLAEEIINKEGCLISEYTTGEEPKPYRFIQRNRIISGISQGTIVIESDIKSGSMKTANYCIKQEKIIGCVDYNNNKIAKGNRELINSGKAMVIREKSDLEEYYGYIKNRML